MRRYKAKIPCTTVLVYVTKTIFYVYVKLLLNNSNTISLTAFCRSIVIATSYLNVIEDSQEENLKKTAEKRAKTTFSIHWAMNEIWSLANGNDNWQRIAKWWFIFGNGGAIRTDTHTHTYMFTKRPHRHHFRAEEEYAVVVSQSVQ